MFAVGMVVVVILCRLVMARSDTLRSFREFVDFRALRIAMQSPLTGSLVIATVLAGVLIPAIGFAQLFGNELWMQRLNWVWVAAIWYIGLVLLIMVVRRMVSEVASWRSRAK